MPDDEKFQQIITKIAILLMTITEVQGFLIFICTFPTFFQQILLKAAKSPKMFPILSCFQKLNRYCSWKTKTDFKDVAKLKISFEIQPPLPKYFDFIEQKMNFGVPMNVFTRKKFNFLTLFLQTSTYHFFLLLAFKLFQFIRSEKPLLKVS